MKLSAMKIGATNRVVVAKNTTGSDMLKLLKDFQEGYTKIRKEIYKTDKDAAGKLYDLIDKMLPPMKEATRIAKEFNSVHGND